MKTTLTRLFLLTSLSMAAAMAQRPMNQRGTPPDPATMVQRRVEMLTRSLGLSDAQASQATTIFTNAQAAAAPLRTSMQDARTALQTAVKANDTGGITVAANNIGNVTGQEVANQAKAEAAFYAILTADQKTKYDQRGPGRGGPGGPGGMGMGPGGMGMGPGGMGMGGPMGGRPPR